MAFLLTQIFHSVQARTNQKQYLAEVLKIASLWEGSKVTVSRYHPAENVSHVDGTTIVIDVEAIFKAIMDQDSTVVSTNSINKALMPDLEAKITADNILDSYRLYSLSIHTPTDPFVNSSTGTKFIPKKIDLNIGTLNAILKDVLLDMKDDAQVLHCRPTEKFSCDTPEAELHAHQITTNANVEFYKTLTSLYKEELVNTNPDFLQESLDDAAFMNNVGFAQFFLENGAEINGKIEGKSPLMVAAEFERCEMASFLLSKGAAPSLLTANHLSLEPCPEAKIMAESAPNAANKAMPNIKLADVISEPALFENSQTNQAPQTTQTYQAAVTTDPLIHIEQANSTSVL
ncbi:MAG: hypothetical protein ACHQJ6_08065 [Candidatus Berkiellales bacterium]